MADFFNEIGHLFSHKLIQFNSILEEETRKSDSVLEIPDVHEKRIEAFPQHLLLLTLTEDNVADRIEVAERISSETSPFAGDQCDRIENCDKVKLLYCPDLFP